MLLLLLPCLLHFIKAKLVASGQEMAVVAAELILIALVLVEASEDGVASALVRLNARA